MTHGAGPRVLTAVDKGKIASLVALSARLGRDPLLVQGSNGNTSIKLGEVLWIKSSGKWLANAQQEELLSPIRLADVEEAISHNQEIAPVCKDRGQLLPSIETAMHAVLRHRVVLHVHSVNTIAWAIRLDGRMQVQERLAGLNWSWIPYVGSGIPLALEIAKRVADAPATDVFVLGNHGLVICGDNCDAAEALLSEVERRLWIQPRQSPEPQPAGLAAVSRFSPWRFPDPDSLHALGTDEVSFRILKGGIVYPCQAIFLGPTVPLLPQATLWSSFTSQLSAIANTQPFLVVEGSGLMVNKNITNAELANLIGLMQVIQRTEEAAPIRYLTSAEVSNVLSSRAYSYKAVAMRSETVSIPVRSH